MKTTKKQKTVKIPLTDEFLEKLKGQPFKLIAYRVSEDSSWEIQSPGYLMNDGWTILSPCNFSAILKDDKISFVDGENDYVSFYDGRIVFDLPWLFKVDRIGIGINIKGPPNYIKYNCQALEDSVSNEYTHIQWKIITPNIPVSFKKGEPIAYITPYDKNLVSRTKFSIEEHEENYVR